MWSRWLGNEAIIAMVGHEAFARGMVYARNGQVTDVEIDRDAMLVTGRVQGGYRDGYATSVRLVVSDDGWTGHQGRCSCPVALDCKHAAALLVVARSVAAQTGDLDRPPWEVALSRLVHAPEPVVAAEPAVLGLELEVESGVAFRHHSRPDLRMRPVRRAAGKAGPRGDRWLRSGVSWDELDFASRDYRADHRDLLLQLRSAAGAAARFSLPRSPWLSLREGSAGLWSLLTRAADVGLELVVAGRTVPDLVSTRPAEVVLDTRRLVEGTLSLLPRLLLHGEPVPVGTWGLIGDPAHGAFLLGTGADDLRLAPLAAPLSRELRRLLDAGAPLLVPAADQARFAAEFLPTLRRRASLLSLDGSYAVPDVPRPELELAVGFRPGQLLRLDWAYAYPSVDARFPLDDRVDAPTFRDRAAELALLRTLPLPDPHLPQLGSAGVPEPHVLLQGIDAAVCVEQVLPRLRDAGVRVVETGERVDYRRSDSELRIELSTSEPDGVRDAGAASDWFDLHVDVRVDGEVVPFEELFTAVSRGEEFLVLDTGVYLPLQRPELERLRGLIDEARLLQDRDQGPLRISAVQTALWDELVQLGVVVGQAERWVRAVEALSGDTDPPAVPASVRADLRPYQREGFAWLARLWTAGIGGVLADDMGLGKTLQTLALMTYARERAPDDPPFLVVAPTSVVPNWAAEAARFTPGLRVLTVESSRSRDRRDLGEVVADSDVVVTSYALLRLDVDAYAGLSWAGLVLDEAQFVKNHRARTYAAARRVATPFSLAITGTPLENSLMDLWALFSITAPGLFPHPERFAEHYRRPIERSHDAERLAQLRRRVRPLMLRRTKEEVATDLPPKQEQVVDVVLQARHQRIYSTYLQRERQKVLGLIDDLDGNRFTILRSLTLLRQLSLDPALVDDQYEGVAASKVEVLLEMLGEVVGEDHQALVFSQFTSFLDRVQTRLDAAGIAYARLDGRTRRRAEVIDRFRGGEAKVFLISLKAGGFGLNLTEAGYCFVMDPWWNPAAEAQAVDRTHRIGQDKTVLVYRLVARDTIEQKVMDLKARKARLFDAVVGADTLDSGRLDAADIRELLSLPEAPAEPSTDAATRAS